MNYRKKILVTATIILICVVVLTAWTYSKIPKTVNYDIQVVEVKHEGSDVTVKFYMNETLPALHVIDIHSQNRRWNFAIMEIEFEKNDNLTLKIKDFKAGTLIFDFVFEGGNVQTIEVKVTEGVNQQC